MKNIVKIAVLDFEKNEEDSLIVIVDTKWIKKNGKNIDTRNSEFFIIDSSGEVDIIITEIDDLEKELKRSQYNSSIKQMEIFTGWCFIQQDWYSDIQDKECDHNTEEDEDEEY